MRCKRASEKTPAPFFIGDLGILGVIHGLDARGSFLIHGDPKPA